MASTKSRQSEVRNDPKPRYAGAPPVFQLKNRDPGKHYVWVALATPAEGQGVEYYTHIGYDVERWGADAAQPLVKPRDAKDGDEISVRGQVLMSTTTERYEEIVRTGVDGEGGLAWAAKNEKAMRLRKGEHDPLRGMSNIHGYIRQGGEVSPLTVELGAS